MLGGLWCGSGGREWACVHQNGHGAPRASQSSISASSKDRPDASSKTVFPLRFIIRVLPAAAIEATIEGRHLRSARLLYS